MERTQTILLMCRHILLYTHSYKHRCEQEPHREDQSFAVELDLRQDSVRDITIKKKGSGKKEQKTFWQLFFDHTAKRNAALMLLLSGPQLAHLAALTRLRNQSLMPAAGYCSQACSTTFNDFCKIKTNLAMSTLLHGSSFLCVYHLRCAV